MPHDDQPVLPRGTAQFLPPELNEAYFENIDKLLARQEAQALQRNLEDLESRGFFRSGQTLREVSENILGPALQRRQTALLPLAREAAFAGREERLGEVQFQRQRQFAEEESDRRLRELGARATINRQLMELQSELEERGGFGIGEFLGQAAGAGIGSLFGGVGAGIGAGIGRRIGQRFGGGGRGSRFE